MRYLSVCSGIEAATQAWHPLGWSPVAFSEIEKFPSAVLAHHYGSNMPGEPLATNGVPNLGDMTKFKDWPDYAIDLLVGGTPCQSFSIAGLRKGLADPRGNLMLTYLSIAQRYRPRWVVWENVPGVLSSNGGRDFGTFIRGLEECGYHAAWRVLDAQFIRTQRFSGAVPQRRRRVFVVGYLGDWRPAAAVLLDPESMRGNPAPRRKTRERVAPTISARTKGGGGLGTDFDLDGGLVTNCGATSYCVSVSVNGQRSNDAETETLIAHAIQAGALRENPNSGPDGAGVQEGVAYTIEARAEVQAVAFAENSRSEVRLCGGDGTVSSQLTTGGGKPGQGQACVALALAFDCKAAGDTGFSIDEVPGSLRAAHGGGHSAVAYDMRGREGGAQFEGPHETANIRAGSGGSSRSYVAAPWAVRRLTPRECERLQAFPDDFTLIPWRGKAAENCPDGPRYKALGNSMAVNVMEYIGERIQYVEDLQKELCA
ncbi:DNA (cytosine-5-)-methyltransferase [Martelella lutilitoris]|uniref:Cytosine-specific methyltransferase n=1 Tax=Martelella lutilitoris TaxID=2583532 RepID=A0A7T7KK87_9HYPH|nr:DNA (cytosine-5-)-methyltransferase [Martelella lutilitoris]QQM29313.1 DNA (cytosine-5-)-methyltransferase [Martelella lutilitoris]